MGIFSYLTQEYARIQAELLIKDAFQGIGLQIHYSKSMNESLRGMVREAWETHPAICSGEQFGIKPDYLALAGYALAYSASRNKAHHPGDAHWKFHAAKWCLAGLRTDFYNPNSSNAFLVDLANHLIDKRADHDDAIHIILNDSKDFMHLNTQWRNATSRYILAKIIQQDAFETDDDEAEKIAQRSLDDGLQQIQEDFPHILLDQSYSELIVIFYSMGVSMHKLIQRDSRNNVYHFYLIFNALRSYCNKAYTEFESTTESEAFLLLAAHMYSNTIDDYIDDKNHEYFTRSMLGAALDSYKLRNIVDKHASQVMYNNTNPTIDALLPIKILLSDWKFHEYQIKVEEHDVDDSTLEVIANIWPEDTPENISRVLSINVCTTKLKRLWVAMKCMHYHYVARLPNGGPLYRSRKAAIKNLLHRRPALGDLSEEALEKYIEEDYRKIPDVLSSKNKIIYQMRDATYNIQGWYKKLFRSISSVIEQRCAHNNQYAIILIGFDDYRITKDYVERIKRDMEVYKQHLKSKVFLIGLARETIIEL